MIGQVVIGKAFGGVVRYVLEKEQVEVLDQHGVRSENPTVAIQDFNAVRIQNSRVKNAVWHTSISFAYDDKLSSEQMKQIGHDYIHQMGLTDHQYLMVRHHDTEHHHIHIIANRIGYDGQVASDKWCKNRTARICDRLEEKYGLVIARLQGNNKRNARDKVPLKKQLKSEIKKAITESLERGTSSYDQLIEELKQKGIETVFQTQRTGRVNGVSFRYRGISFKGSSIDKSFSFRRLAKGLKQNINHDQEQDHEERRKN